MACSVGIYPVHENPSLCRPESLGQFPDFVSNNNSAVFLHLAFGVLMSVRKVSPSE